MRLDGAELIVLNYSHEHKQHSPQVIRFQISVLRSLVFGPDAAESFLSGNLSSCYVIDMKNG